MAKRAQKTTDEPEAGQPVYIVTDKAPPYVAGRKVEPGQTLQLTSEQALFEVTAGHLRLSTSSETPPAPENTNI